VRAICQNLLEDPSLNSKYRASPAVLVRLTGMLEAVDMLVAFANPSKLTYNGDF